MRARSASLQFDGERYGQRYHGAAGLRCGIYYHHL